MSRVTLLLFVGLLLALVGNAQVVSLSGTVINAQTGEAIPFAHLQIKGSAVGTSTNLEGDFDLKLRARYLDGGQVLMISCIGYASAEIRLAANMDRSLVVRLTPTVKSLDEVVINGTLKQQPDDDRARRLVQKAIRKIPNNYIKTESMGRAFYRHYCAENDTYVRLIEAALDLYRSGKEPYRSIIPEDNLGFRVNQLRRSFDFTASSKLKHPPFSLNFLLSNDVTAYEYQNPLLTHFNTIDFWVQDTTSYESDEVVIIGYFTDQGGTLRDRSFAGQLYINTSNFVILQHEGTESYESSYPTEGTRYRLYKKVQYLPYQEKYYLNRATSDLTAEYFQYDSLGATIDSLVHTSHIELINTEIVFDEVEPAYGKEPRQQQLVTIDYDSTFWHDYTVLQATSLEEKIINDLSEKLEIEEQFVLYNQLLEGGGSIIDSDAFQRMAALYEGQPTYFILWSADRYPTLLDLIPKGYFKRQVKKGKANLVLVGLGMDEPSWRNRRDAHLLNQKWITHERLDYQLDKDIYEELYNDVLPYSLLVDPGGKMITNDPPVPGDRLMKAVLKELSNLQESESPLRPEPNIR